jgi:hypothetical protein
VSFDFQKMIESKRAMRQRLAARPLAEKLRLLDALRERTVAIRNATVQGASQASVLEEKPAPYRGKAAGDS